MFRGWKEYRLIKKSGLFDERYYLTQYPDVRRADIDPVKHFILKGWSEGKNPNGSFNTNFYLEKYTDVKASGINPLVHYIKWGKLEGCVVGEGESRIVSLNVFSRSRLRNKFSSFFHRLIYLVRYILSYRHVRHGFFQLFSVMLNRFLYKISRKNQTSSIMRVSERWSIQGMHTEPKEEYSVSVVIPTYNAGADISYLLSSLKRQKKCNAQIIMVDSESSDMTCNVVKFFNVECIHIKKSQFTHSFARNQGLSLVKNDKVLFMVQDALPTDDWWLWRFCNIFETVGVVALSCAQTPRSDADLMTIWNVLSFNKFMGLSEDVTLVESSFNNLDECDARKKCQLDNVACMYRTSELMKHEFKGKYGEDIKLGMTLLKIGKKIGKTSELKVIHSHNRDAFYYFRRTVIETCVLCNENLMPLPNDKLIWGNTVAESKAAVIYSVLLLRLLSDKHLSDSFKDLELSIGFLNKDVELSFSNAIDEIKFYDESLGTSLLSLFNENGVLKADFINNMACHIENMALDGIKFYTNIYNFATLEFIELLKKFVLQSMAITIGTNIAYCFVSDKVPKDKREIVNSLMDNI